MEEKKESDLKNPEWVKAYITKWIQKNTDFDVEELNLKAKEVCLNKDGAKIICNKGFACDACPYNDDLLEKQSTIIGDKNG